MRLHPGAHRSAIKRAWRELPNKVGEVDVDGRIFPINIWDKVTGAVIYHNQLGADQDAAARTSSSTPHERGCAVNLSNRNA